MYCLYRHPQHTHTHTHTHTHCAEHIESVPVSGVLGICYCEHALSGIWHYIIDRERGADVQSAVGSSSPGPNHCPPSTLILCLSSTTSGSIWLQMLLRVITIIIIMHDCVYTCICTLNGPLMPYVYVEKNILCVFLCLYYITLEFINYW